MPAVVRREGPLSVLGAFALAALQWWPAFARLDATGFGDWQMIHHNWEAAHVSLTRFREWPLWDPFHCGGIPILGNPESQLYSPLFLLSLPLGTVVAVKLFLWLHVSAGVLGMYWLARTRYGLHPLACGLAAAGWGCSGAIAWDGAGGHATFLPFLFAPLALLFFHRGLTSLRSRCALAALLALTLYEGGTYPFPYLLLLLGFDAVVALATGSPLRSVLKTLLGVGALVALCGAIRLLPIAVMLADTPRTLPSTDALELRHVWTMLTARSHPWRSPEHTYVWAEYGSYVGVALVGLGSLGALQVLRTGPRHLLWGLVLFLLLMLGNRAQYYPWPLLHHLPFFDSLRVPSRFSVLFTLYLALLAAHPVSSLLKRARSHYLLAAACLLLAGYIADLSVVNHPVIDRFDRPPLEPSKPAAAFHLVGGNYGRRYASYPRRHLGSPACYNGGMEWRVARGLWLGKRAQARVPAGSGRVRSFERRASSFALSVELLEPARVVINQNHAAGWRSEGAVIVEDRGRLALELPAGSHTLAVRYQPREFLPALWLSLVGWLVWLGCLILARRGPSRRPS